MFRNDNYTGEGAQLFVRISLATLLVVVSALLAVWGLISVLIGFREREVAAETYQVGFVYGTGGDCDSARGLYIRVTDGEALSCEPSYLLSGSPDLPGFTSDQVQTVTGLAHVLAQQRGLLSATEQARIQAEVDRILATVPPEERKYGDTTIWGNRRIGLGAGMTLLGLAGFFGVWRIMKAEWI